MVVRIVISFWVCAWIAALLIVLAALYLIETCRRLKCIDALTAALPVLITLSLLSSILITVWESFCFLPSDATCVYV